MEDKDLAVAQIVSSIISKDKVMVGADNEKGVQLHIKEADELVVDHRSPLKLEDLIKQVRKTL